MKEGREEQRGTNTAKASGAQSFELDVYINIFNINKLRGEAMIIKCFYYNLFMGSETGIVICAFAGL